jgi:hypothetical protein
MPTMNVSLPDALSDFVAEQLKAGYNNGSLPLISRKNVRYAAKEQVANGTS